MAFYVAIHSDASADVFPNNRPGDFKNYLNKEIDLGNEEYMVAVSSINRYFETSSEDLVFVREKRQIPPKRFEFEENFPIPSEEELKELEKKYEDFLAYTDMVLAYSEDPALKFEATVTRNKKT